jgi:osmoprotectant transport system substrate-binding protein
VYGIDVTEDLPLGFGSPQNKQAVVDGKAQLGLSGTTDGTLGALGPGGPRGRQAAAERRQPRPRRQRDGPAGSEEVAELLNGLSGTLTTEDLAELNRRVDEDREQAAGVAQDYLSEKGLLEA